MRLGGLVARRVVKGGDGPSLLAGVVRACWCPWHGLASRDARHLARDRDRDRDRVVELLSAWSKYRRALGLGQAWVRGMVEVLAGMVSTMGLPRGWSAKEAL